MMKWFMALTESVEPVAEVVETAAVSNSALVEMPLFTKGLLTTAMGLLGVFLVLTLFFVTIKLMQKIGTKESPKNKEGSPCTQGKTNNRLPVRPDSVR